MGGGGVCAAAVPEASKRATNATARTSEDQGGTLPISRLCTGLRPGRKSMTFNDFLLCARGRASKRGGPTVREIVDELFEPRSRVAVDGGGDRTGEPKVVGIEALGEHVTDVREILVAIGELAIG